MSETRNVNITSGTFAICFFLFLILCQHCSLVSAVNRTARAIEKSNAVTEPSK